MAPFSSVHYAGDHKWWAAYREIWQNFPGLKFTINPAATKEFPGIILLKQEGKLALGRVGVGTGGNSGYQAANLAYLLGATKIYLLGFDNMPKGVNNHWHPDHNRKKGHLSNPTPYLYKQWGHALSKLHELMAEQGVELINLSRETAHTIPRQTLEEALNV